MLEKGKTIFELVLTYAPILFSFASLFIAWRTFSDVKTTTKDNFINSLRKDINIAKHQILAIEIKIYSQADKLRINEAIQDLLLYQGYKKEKNKHLSAVQKSELSKLQEDIEDYVSCILNKTDVENNRLSSVHSLKGFLENL